MNRINKIIDLSCNMGLHYVAFRIGYILSTKLGIIKKKTPLSPNFKKFIDLKDWKEDSPKFFFQSKNDIFLTKNKSEILYSKAQKILSGQYPFFNKEYIDLSSYNDWITNPVTGYKYNINKHWSQIQDISSEAGDIKFVWEKARFSWLYDIIRYDYHFNIDMSEFVFGQIEDFIIKNPINQGPNYKCSQEISLRVLNWTFALYYFKDSNKLTSELFDKIINSIYWQLHHVYQNINFSRISVRNNHAITETMTLFLSGLLFPFIPETKKWSEEGKKWFEEEIDYQVYKDGTFLQYSMNYHRVVIQLLTWGIRLADIHNVKLASVVKERAKKSLSFLRESQDKISGKLPNYGSNDGALFFPLTDDDYRNYTSQLNDLAGVLREPIMESYIDTLAWYGVYKQDISIQSLTENKISLYKEGGYIILNEEKTKTFLNCSSYKDRPSQSDNNHLDIWYNGVNYLRDTGTYKYNTNKKLIDFFTGVRGHNTISVQGENQMLKGGRFIWYNWIKESDLNYIETEEYHILEASFIGFKTLGKNIRHNRKVFKKKGELFWRVEDKIINANKYKKQIFWHPDPDYLSNIDIKIYDRENNPLNIEKQDSWYSGYYGVKEKAISLTAESTNMFITEIRIKI